MIRKMLPLIIISLLVLPAGAKAASEWGQAVTVYGAGLEDNRELLDATGEILGATEEDKVEYVRSDDVEKYLGVTYDDSILKSSIRILQKDAGAGLDITVDESMGQITEITEETYKNALLTSGITDAEVVIGAAEDVTGESRSEYVRRDDVGKYLGVTYDDSILKSSIRILQKDAGAGLDITVDESMGQITEITEETYKNALLTSGITDAEVVIGAAEDVTGES